MFIVYEANKGPTNEIPDFLIPLCQEQDIELDEALAQHGFGCCRQYGGAAASLDVYEGDDTAQYAALVYADFGAGLQVYLMPRLHDLLAFMKEYAGTIKTLLDLEDCV